MLIVINYLNHIYSTGHCIYNLKSFQFMSVTMFIEQGTGYTGIPVQGSLTEREGSVQFTSLYKLVQIGCFLFGTVLFSLYKTTYLNEEVNRTDPSPSVRLPWSVNQKLVFQFYSWLFEPATLNKKKRQTGRHWTNRLVGIIVWVVVPYPKSDHYSLG